MSIWEIALWIGTPMAGLFLVACRIDAALAAADAKRREGDAAEYVLWVEEGPA